MRYPALDEPLPGDPEYSSLKKRLKRCDVLSHIIEEEGYEVGVELGLCDGRTSIFLLEHHPRLTMHGVDLWTAKGGKSFDFNSGYEAYDDPVEWDHKANRRKCEEAAKRFGDRFHIIHEDTAIASARFEPESLDFVFIDADHTIAGVERDIRAWLPKIKPGGMMIGDDLDWPTVKKAIDNMGLSYEGAPDSVWWSIK